MRSLIKILNIKCVVAYYFGSRTAPLVIAAKLRKIPVVGFMHGFAMPDWNVNEFIEVFNGKKHLGPDFFGVWSKWAFRNFVTFGKILPEAAIELSGPIRPLNVDDFPLSNSFHYDTVRPKILFVTTIISDAREVADYLRVLIESNQFDLALKIRPMVRDQIYEQLLDMIPELRNVPTYSGNIIEVGKKFDVFVSTGSAALLEAALINKLSVTYYTDKVGDFYDFDSLLPGLQLCVRSPSDLVGHIKWRLEEETKIKTINVIREQFFEIGKNGAQWVSHKVQQLVGG